MLGVLLVTYIYVFSFRVALRQLPEIFDESEIVVDMSYARSSHFEVNMYVLHHIPVLD